MKTKLLKKVRKRFTWRLVKREKPVLVRTSYVTQEVDQYALLDHEKKSVGYYDTLRDVFKVVVSRVLGSDMDVWYQERRKEHRQQKARYNKALKDINSGS